LDKSETDFWNYAGNPLILSPRRIQINRAINMHSVPVSIYSDLSFIEN